MIRERDAAEVFWAEITPCDHLVQIYEEDSAFLDSLEGFIAGGLRRGEAAVVIATPPHRDSLTSRLLAQHIDLDAAISKDQYIALDAEETLSQFMRDGWPDDDLFNQCIRGIVDRARGRGRRVRAFGEMVALLWAQGHNGATVRLEHLWHTLCRTDSFSLLCAYPKSGFTQDANDSIREICAAHSKVVEQWN